MWVGASQKEAFDAPSIIKMSGIAREENFVSGVGRESHDDSCTVSSPASVNVLPLCAFKISPDSSPPGRVQAIGAPPEVWDISSAASSPTTTATATGEGGAKLSSLRLERDVEDEDVSLGPPVPAYFVSAVMAECNHIFGNRANLRHIAANFLCRFSIYDQIVLSALLSEGSGYCEQQPLNSDVVLVIFDIVKAHVAVMEGSKFCLRRRGSNLSECRWYSLCEQTFNSSLPPLPTPTAVFNQLIDGLLPPLPSVSATSQDERLDILQRQNAVATEMTKIVYPNFDPKWGDKLRTDASNEVFFAAGFLASTEYSDPTVRIASVARLCSMLLGVIANVRAAKGDDTYGCLEAYEMCFIGGQCVSSL